MKGVSAVVVAVFVLTWPAYAEQVPSAVASQPKETANAPKESAAATEVLPPPAYTSDVPPGALPGEVVLAGPGDPYYYHEGWYHHDDEGMFPLAGFALLPGLGDLDPYNLGVTWPLGDLVDPVPLDHHHQRNWLAGRVGWWSTVRSGSANKVGEWQDLGPSPFWDLDGLYSDSVRTYNFTATGLDNETTQGALQYYGPLFRAEIDVQRFLHRLDHDPIDNIASDRPLPVPQGFSGIYKTDLNAGEDYAFRVEQLKGEMSTNLTDKVRLRVDVFGMRKFGERQANAMAHCFQARGISGRNCHILSQRQQIDWRTIEVTPRLQGTWGPVTVEYSRLMRQFSQDDQPVFREYTGFRPTIIDGTFPYAVVPDITTQIDQLRLNVDVARKTRFYGFGYVGRMDDLYRDTHRNLYGYDLRLTDYSYSGLRLTAYTNGYHQNGNLPTILIPSETQSKTTEEALASIPEQIGFHRTTAGFRGRYLPRLSQPALSHLALTGGYQYSIMDRDNAVYEQSDEAFSFSQPSTITNTIHVGVQQPWSACVDSYARYRVEFIANPVYGFRETSGVINSGLPQERHVVELGGGWYPAPNFGVSGRQEVDLNWHTADISEIPDNVVDFDAQSYSTTGTVWYAPTEKIALMASGAYMSNWIDQNIPLGDDYLEPGADNARLLAPITRPWYYLGTSTVLTTRIDYKLSPTVRTYAGYEYVRGRNRIDNRGFADLWPDLGTYSEVLARTHRILVGVDWNPTELIGTYLRYVYFDYDDVTSPNNSGNVHMLLAGLSLVR